jgi:hypothetical protein
MAMHPPATMANREDVHMAGGLETATGRMKDRESVRGAGHAVSDFVKAS